MMPIRILPARLANQIAAGEVVERPASVVKELVENSLDAGATRIDIDIEKGGRQLIRIRDNGCGIEKEELELALSRHATSKIHHLDDLEAITSLGFRGEALASVSSVARLTLTSRPAHQAEAWSAIAEGRDMAVRLLPAAHPVGSTVEVADLFFNTPARRKFLRTDKTEFQHIDELLKRIALSRQQVTFTLTHNGKNVRQYRAAASEAMQRRRLAAICGSAFAEQALHLSWQQDELSIHGWLTEPSVVRAQPDLQYCYVNGRMMRDKVINHAIRQAYDGMLSSEYYPCYVLFIELSPHEVDVNVHPAKHEVRFHQARLVHDFIFQAVSDVLAAGREPNAMQRPAADAVPVSYPHQVVAGTLRHANAGEEQSHAVNASRIAEPLSNYQVNAEIESSAPSRIGRALPTKHPTSKGAVVAARQVSPLYQQLFATPEPQSDSGLLGPSHLTPKGDTTSVARRPHQTPLGEPLALLSQGRVLLRGNQQWHLLNIAQAQQSLVLAQLMCGLTQGLKPQPLLIPMRLTLSSQQRQAIHTQQSWLAQFGIGLCEDAAHVVLQTVCQPLRHYPAEQWLSPLLMELGSAPSVLDEAASQLILRHLVEQLPLPMVDSMAQVIQLLNQLEQCWHRQLAEHASAFLRSIDEQAFIRLFEHD